ncbi:FHA domain-containing protein [Ideonella dechloratans]|uniref:FHA domain-containing protein n=1 Tax=Ideonella dechloratans TaxID=36863 RepID=A0A643FBQ7_IDEDE|nr:adenylate/guanylate cyclase domain-containing protein [Ideonella dechloratans]KAB0580920.1 FHA domain-containing protein [Ideonella dechloratans]UFU08829.1 FHA domain-containing protein [Ideonella dechloratans]
MATIRRRTVLFADFRGSTALYEALGNAQASSVVSELMRPLVRCIPACGGQLVKTLGDGLMAVFPNSSDAVVAAVQMQEELERLPPRQLDEGRTGLPHLQVAITAGEVVEMGGDCFGDAVNVAARLLEHAGDGELLVSRDVHDELVWEVQSRFRRLDRVHLRGRNEPVEIFQFSRQTGPDTQVTQLEDASEPAEVQGLELVWAGGIHTYHRDELPLVLGRAAGANLIVDDARVSRSHARIELQGGALQLTDLSINGTFVRFAGEDEVISLRRGSCTLHGRGQIGLGGSPNDPSAPVVSFDLLSDPPERIETLPLFN